MNIAYVFFADGFEETEAITVVDVLRRADIHTQMVSIMKGLEVTGAHGIKVTTDILFDQVNEKDALILVLPGGMPGSENLNSHTQLKELLVRFSTEGGKVAAICAAPMVLGSAWLLKGHRAVCYPGFEDKLTGADLVYDPACVSENIITGRGVGAALHFSLTIIEQLKGKALANEMARNLLVPDW